MKWIAAELHTHTRHSDGSFSTKELLEAAKDHQLDVVAITDHNTTAPLNDLSNPILPVLRGIEWTTYYGHLLVLGDYSMVDWRDATPDNIQDKLSQLKAMECLTGIVHPFDLGSPLCTGCHWEYDLDDYHNIDYIEVWNGSTPCHTMPSQRAIALWSDLLDCGYRLSATSGRDWHGHESSPDPTAVTYLGVEDTVSHDTALQALRSGRTSITMGPLLTLSTPDGHTMGDTISPMETMDITMSVDCTTRKAQWKSHSIEVEWVTILTKGGKRLNTSAIPPEGGDILVNIKDAEGYIRAELHGKVQGKECIIALTSPLYLTGK